MTQVVGIGGKLASGKDAIADYLVSEYGWTKFGMSDALADALYTLDPYIPQFPLREFNKFQLWILRRFFYLRPDTPFFGRYAALYDRVGYVEAKTNDEVRRLLQVLGTEVGRKQLSDGNLWTEIMKRKIAEAEAAGAPGIIVTGVRFPNEIQLFDDELEAETWWVDRPSLKATANAGHASENSVSAVDFERVIRNDGTLEDLYRKVDALVT